MENKPSVTIEETFNEQLEKQFYVKNKNHVVFDRDPDRPKQCFGDDWHQRTEWEDLCVNTGTCSSRESCLNHQQDNLPQVQSYEDLLQLQEATPADAAELTLPENLPMLLDDLLETEMQSRRMTLESSEQCPRSNNGSCVEFVQGGLQDEKPLLDSSSFLTSKNAETHNLSQVDFAEVKMELELDFSPCSIQQEPTLLLSCHSEEDQAHSSQKNGVTNPDVMDIKIEPKQELYHSTANDEGLSEPMQQSFGNVKTEFEPNQFPQLPQQKHSPTRPNITSRNSKQHFDLHIVNSSRDLENHTSHTLEEIVDTQSGEGVSVKMENQAVCGLDQIWPKKSPDLHKPIGQKNLCVEGEKWPSQENYTNHTSHKECLQLRDSTLANSVKMTTPENFPSGRMSCSKSGNCGKTVETEDELEDNGHISLPQDLPRNPVRPSLRRRHKSDQDERVKEGMEWHELLRVNILKCGGQDKARMPVIWGCYKDACTIDYNGQDYNNVKYKDLVCLSCPAKTVLLDRYYNTASSGISCDLCDQPKNNSRKKRWNEDMTFTSQASFKVHLLEMHSFSVWCPHCFRVLQNGLKLSEHKKKFHPDEGLLLTDMYKDFVFVGDSQGDRSYICTICNKSFEDVKNFENHLDLCNPMSNRVPRKKLKQCPECKEYFSCLRLHTKRMHKQTAKAPCQECGRVYASSSQLKKHIKEVHQKLQPHVCSFCKRAFSQKHNLRVHERIHTGERPFLCRFCGKGFTTKQWCQSHEKIHC